MSSYSKNDILNSHCHERLISLYFQAVSENISNSKDRLCGLVVRVPGYISRGRGSIPGATRFSEKYYVWNGVHSASQVEMRSYLEEKVATPV
jgi:hypothetical protein